MEVVCDEPVGIVCDEPVGIVCDEPVGIVCDEPVVSCKFGVGIVSGKHGVVFCGACNRHG